MRTAQHRSSLFLVELIIDLALFAICAAVCVALLVHARGMSAESTRLTQAVYMAQDIAEEWKGGSDVFGYFPDQNGLAGSVQDRGDAVAIVITDTATGEAVYVLEGVTRLE